MKIFTASQIHACDTYTIQSSGIHSYDLMERAAGKCVEWLRTTFSKDTLFVILCGTGNNGGDGLCVARMLHQRGYGVKAFLLKMNKDLSPDCNSAYQRIKAIDANLVSMVEPDTYITDLPAHIVIIDAIFGTGLSRPPQGWISTFIQRIDGLANMKIAIDIPSGLPADLIPDPEAAILKAQHTLSFQFYKRSFLHPESAPMVGQIHLLDIGLDKNFINNTHTQFRTLGAEDIQGFYKRRKPFSHKGTYGSALIAGGSYGKTGAIVLSASAALRAGAGLVTALLPECGYTAIQAAIPEVMCETSGERFIEKISHWEAYSAIGIGPGLGTEPKTAKALAEFIELYKKPLVLDADALNIIATQRELLAKLPKGSIFTPHRKEFSRMFGENTSSMIQLDHARIQAMRYNINIVLKGHHTCVVTTEGDCWYNMNGNPGMATAGSGDVLTGIITGLLAQGYAPHEAAIFGVYLHGYAGDLAAKELSQESMVAGDIIRYLGRAYLSLGA